MRYCHFLILILCAVSASVGPASAAGTALEKSMWVCAGYFEKRIDRVEASFGIRNYRERFLATKKGAVRRAVFVFPVAYRIMRDHLRSQTATRFGEASFAEYDAIDLRNDVAMTPGEPAKVPGTFLMPGDQIASRSSGSIPVDGVAGVRIATKPYNGVPSKKGWSDLHLMALDGSKITGLDSTLVVVWRYDSAEQWGTGKSGRLLDFGRHRSGDTFVTSTEFGLMERLRKLYRTPFAVFPLSSTGPLAKDAASLAAARAWLKKYQDDPDNTSSAVNPASCG